MAFRDPEAFNQALLAKQAWRILQQPTFLCARVLKARYLSADSILTATALTSASYTFRSILWGRDLLREGLIWRIGNGAAVNIHHNNWIPRAGSMKPLGQIFVSGLTKVAHLITTDGGSWDMDKVNLMFSEDDAKDIQQIAIGGPSCEDYLAWNYAHNGVYSVRSGYHLRKALDNARNGQPESSSSVGTHRGYMALWDTNAPPKAKIHMWRMIRNGLAAGAELHRRRIKPGFFCVVCGQENCASSFLVMPTFYAILAASMFGEGSYGGSPTESDRLPERLSSLATQLVRRRV